MNFFLDPPADIVDMGVVEKVAQLLVDAGDVLPASLQADSESVYSCAAGRTVEETQRRLLRRTAVVFLLARYAGALKTPLTSGLIVNMHEGIFQPVFHDAVCALRAKPARGDHRDDDGVVYPVWVVRGTGQRPSTVQRRGVRASQVQRRLREACDAFDRRAGGVRGAPGEAAIEIARLYVRLIRIHPFADGNGRTAWAAVQYAAARLAMPVVKSSPTQAARVALGDAIRNGQRLQGLADEILGAMWREPSGAPGGS